MSMKEQITELTHPSMYAWFKEYLHIYTYVLDNSKNGLENGKLNFEDNYSFENELPYIKYSYVNTNWFNITKLNSMFLINSPIESTCNFFCWCSPNLLSFKGFPKGVVSDVGVYYKNEQYSLNYKKNDKYKLYLAMWLEMFDSVTEEERWNYINEFKNRKEYNTEYSVIPKELLLEFGVL